MGSIWSGRVIFWESLSIYRIYRKDQADPYRRLRLSKYQKRFEAISSASFFVLYYAIFVERSPRRIGIVETLQYNWIAAFAYDELGEYQDASPSFYAT